MSITPATPVATPVPALSWLQRHERLIIVALVLLAGAWAYGKYADASVSKAETRAAVAEANLAAQKAQDTQNAAQILQLTQQYQQLTQVLASQNASLATSLAARQTAQAARVATDAQLAPADLATRLESLGNTPLGSVHVSGNEIAMTQPAAVKITQYLEQVPVLQADLKDTTATLQTAEAAQTKAAALIADQDKQITNLNVTLVDTDKVCKAQIAVAKAEGRKSKIRWFKIGYVSGFLSGLWAGHAAGL